MLLSWTIFLGQLLLLFLMLRGLSLLLLKLWDQSRCFFSTWNAYHFSYAPKPLQTLSPGLCVSLCFFHMRWLWYYRHCGVLGRQVIPKSFFICPAIWFLSCPPSAIGPWMFFLGPAAVTANTETEWWLPSTGLSGCELLPDSVTK